MSNKTIYKITITNWNKHNPNMKRGHKSTLIANSFCSDAKLGVVPVTVRWLYLGIVLTCGNHTRDTIELSERQLRDMLESSWSVARALDSLQELQLLSYDKIAVFLNRIEEKGIEEKGKEASSVVEKRPTPVPIKPAPNPDRDSNRKVRQAYFDRYFDRYGVEPVMNAKLNSAIASLVKRLGADDAVAVVQFYVEHNDGYYIRNSHSIGPCLKDCESLRTQWATGRTMTNAKARELERKNNNAENFDEVRRELEGDECPQDDFLKLSR